MTTALLPGVAVAHDCLRGDSGDQKNMGSRSFAQPGDLVVLGAHGLEGLNLRVDLLQKALVPAGPVSAAAVETPSPNRTSILSILQSER